MGSTPAASGAVSSAITDRAISAEDNLQTSAGRGTERPRIKAMTTVSAGSGLATVIMSPLGEVLPALVRVPLATVIAGASFLPAGKQWLDEARAHLRQIKARRQKGTWDAD